MAVIFKPEHHKYHSIDEDPIDWVSVTTLTSLFKQPFDAESQALKSSRNRKSKWYGMSLEEIKAAWKAEGDRATKLGTWYHNQREADLCLLDTIEREGVKLPIIRPIEKDGDKYAPEQKLTNALYPEHFVYLKSVGICGQSDLVEVIGKKVNITDYKTNKEIRLEGFKTWEGITQKMKAPLDHLDDCHINHYALQLSLYMYIILKHNYQLSPGKLTLNHIIFKELGRDKYDYPINELDSNGDPIVEQVVPYDLPYLKSEVISIINWLKDNRGQELKKAA